MTFELIIAVVTLLFRIDHSLTQATRNLDQVTAALRAKS
jgi:hypothetical protein